MKLLICCLAALATVSAVQNYQPSPDLEPLHVPFDALLDVHVRDGLVYYGALQADRARLNQYIAALNSQSVISNYASWDRRQQLAFWINAYNAFVLQTVVNRYPIRGRAPGLPPSSIRQIPGAFDQVKHLAAGRAVTLDFLETMILGGFNDPRVFLAIGRGAVDSGRLRSEAFSAASLERQLADSARQFATAPKHLRIDPLAQKVAVSPILSWRSVAFIAAYADKSFDLAKRTPIETAVVGFVRPYLLPSEEEFIQRNTFQLEYLPFDWSLNDLTGRPSIR